MKKIFRKDIEAKIRAKATHKNYTEYFNPADDKVESFVFTGKNVLEMAKAMRELVADVKDHAKEVGVKPKDIRVVTHYGQRLFAYDMTETDDELEDRIQYETDEKVRKLREKREQARREERWHKDQIRKIRKNRR
jgi:hypothetical protein